VEAQGSVNLPQNSLAETCTRIAAAPDGYRLDSGGSQFNIRVGKKYLYFCTFSSAVVFFS
jgi:hypothetical protein